MQCYIRESEINKHTNFHDIKMLESREDVATLLDTYNEVLNQGVPATAIVDVKEDNDKNYLFLVGEKRVLFGLDLINLINRKYTSRSVTNANIKLLFPQELSRGLYGEDKNQRRAMVKGNLPGLYYEKDNLMISIPKDSEIIIGRSAKRSNFVIEGNPNVSRSQCKIYYDKRDGCIKIEDCNSSYGTYVNSMKVGRGGMVLEVGDVISFVGEKFLVSRK